jgi:hypothetical protein
MEPSQVRTTLVQGTEVHVPPVPEAPFDQEALVNVNPPQTAVQRGGYIRRLFEDREFEAEFMELMAERMDLPQRGRAVSPTRTDMDPPSYQGDDAPWSTQQ